MSDDQVEQEERGDLLIEETHGFGVFDQDDLSDDDPQPKAFFLTEREARGYVMMTEWGCMSPEVRPCALSGTVSSNPGWVLGEETHKGDSR